MSISIFQNDAWCSPILRERERERANNNDDDYDDTIINNKTTF